MTRTKIDGRGVDACAGTCRILWQSRIGGRGDEGDDDGGMIVIQGEGWRMRAERA